MKRYLLITLVIFAHLALTSCTSNRNPYPKSDFIEERWMHEVETNPDNWSRGADTWFFTGDPNFTEEANRHAPPSYAVSTMVVKVGNFSRIKVLGDFQVQLFGSNGPNSASVYGPNEGVRNVAVSVLGDTLVVRQIGPARSIKEVIVRIGVNQLSSLMHLGGCATIEGIRLNGTELEIVAQSPATGNMYLSGDLKVKAISNNGFGNINVFGAKSNGLLVATSNRGSVNVAGNVGLTRISHAGANDINIIGANGLYPIKIYASGMGKVAINGRVNIREIYAKDKTAVFAYPVMSNHMDADLSGYARVGLAGGVNTLNLLTRDSARFWGKDLCVGNAYVKARDWSHVNIASTNKVFASASQSASIYFFGSPDLISQFVSGDGVIIPIWPGSTRCIVARPQASIRDYKGELVREEMQKEAIMRREMRRDASQVNSPRSTKANPYVWKDKKLVENKKFLSP